MRGKERSRELGKRCREKGKNVSGEKRRGNENEMRSEKGDVWKGSEDRRQEVLRSTEWRDNDRRNEER